MADGVLGARWAALGEQIEAELGAWRQAHPRATLTEIELAAEAAAARLHAAIVAALTERTAAERTAAERTAADPPGRARCAGCGGLLRRRGRRARTVLLPHQRQPLTLEREYLWCPTCGVGLSPPG